MISLNPFRPIFGKESKTFKYAHFYRTTLWEKIATAYVVLAGSIFEKHPHVGLLDLLLLLFPTLFQTLAFWSYNYKSLLGKMVFYPSAGVSVFLGLITYSVAAFLIFISFPLILTIHAASLIQSYSLGKKIEALDVVIDHDVGYATRALRSKLSDYLNDNQLTLNDLDIRCEGTYRNLQLHICNVVEEKNRACGANISFDDQTREIFYALLKLNVGRFAYRLEKHNYSFARFGYAAMANAEKSEKTTDDPEAHFVSVELNDKVSTLHDSSPEMKI